MVDLELMAATAWAQEHAARNSDPVEFGTKVAQAYLAAQATRHQLEQICAPFPVPAAEIDARSLIAAVWPATSTVPPTPPEAHRARTFASLRRLVSLLAGRFGKGASR